MKACMCILRGRMLKEKSIILIVESAFKKVGTFILIKIASKCTKETFMLRSLNPNEPKIENLQELVIQQLVNSCGNLFCIWYHGSFKS
jgi:hypothetical protein